MSRSPIRILCAENKLISYDSENVHKTKIHCPVNQLRANMAVLAGLNRRNYNITGILFRSNTLVRLLILILKGNVSLKYVLI